MENLDDPAQATVKGRIVDRQLDIVEGSVTAIKRNVENPANVDVLILTNYLDKMKSLKGKLEGLEKEIVSLNDFRGHLERPVTAYSVRSESSYISLYRGDEKGAFLASIRNADDGWSQPPTN